MPFFSCDYAIFYATFMLLLCHDYARDYADYATLCSIMLNYANYAKLCPVMLYAKIMPIMLTWVGPDSWRASPSQVAARAPTLPSGVVGRQNFAKFLSLPNPRIDHLTLWYVNHHYIQFYIQMTIMLNYATL